MTPQERDLLSRFLDDLSRSNPGQKDAEAQAAIDRALSSNPDGAYVLVQHAILSDQALIAAQARIAELENQAQGASGGSQDPSFLGAAFGKAAPNPPGAPATTPQPAVPPTSAPPPSYAAQDQGWGGQQPYPPQQQPWGAGAPGPFSGGGGIGNFLRSAGTTAAGVAGGAFLFEGLSGLFGGHHGGMGFGGGGMGFGGAPVENVTVNNYGDDGGYGSDSGVDYDSDNGDSSGDNYS